MEAFSRRQLDLPMTRTGNGLREIPAYMNPPPMDEMIYTYCTYTLIDNRRLALYVAIVIYKGSMFWTRVSQNPPNWNLALDIRSTKEVGLIISC
jgi:hypothetical protein